MFKWHTLPDEQKRNILNEISTKTGYPTNIIEKDWWVTVALKAVFSTPWANHLVFKGGTSLSKSWNLIERFSEDIDLAIDRSVLGFDAEILSKSQIRKLRERSAAFMENTFLNGLYESILVQGIAEHAFTVTIKPIPEKDIEPRILMLNYQSVVTGNAYVQDRVLIEIGARSLREPCSPAPITSLISDAFPTQPFADAPFLVETVHPERTFLEKVCLLHEEFAREPERRRHERLSRHLYDLHRVMDTDHGRSAIVDKELFQTIVAHRQKYNAVSGITYDRHTYREIDFVPPDTVLEYWREDYNTMLQTMIYGQAPNFDQLIERLQVLRKRFRAQVND